MRLLGWHYFYRLVSYNEDTGWLFIVIVPYGNKMLYSTLDMPMLISFILSLCYNSSIPYRSAEPWSACCNYSIKELFFINIIMCSKNIYLIILCYLVIYWITLCYLVAIGTDTDCLLSSGVVSHSIPTVHSYI